MLLIEREVITPEVGQDYERKISYAHILEDLGINFCSDECASESEGVWKSVENILLGSAGVCGLNKLTFN